MGEIMGTVIVGIILASIVGFIIKNMIKDKKAGKSIQCGGDCKNCSGHCHWRKINILLKYKLCSVSIWNIFIDKLHNFFDFI